ncbi:MAG TPA: DUF983 domain-containing protein [Actinomycetota bacterium]|jgi:uncharacterized protein (DUF983 family)|nr:DUF983 domain-containing protein [Actinomycetota bacterium]
MTRTPRDHLYPSLGTMLRRALRRRCPRCGGGNIFGGYFRLRRACPTCGHLFERESGYWVSAMIVNTAVTEAIFGILFVTVLFATIPDVRWVPLLAIGLGTNLLIPIFFYPYSKTVWMAIDLHFHKPGT